MKKASRSVKTISTGKAKPQPANGASRDQRYFDQLARLLTAPPVRVPAQGKGSICGNLQRLEISLPEHQVKALVLIAEWNGVTFEQLVVEAITASFRANLEDICAFANGGNIARCKSWVNLLDAAYRSQEGGVK